MPNDINQMTHVLNVIKRVHVEVEGLVEIVGGWGIIHYVGEESGDWVPYFFKINTDLGRKILAQCHKDEMCQVVGSAISLKSMPVKLEDNLSSSAIYELQEVRFIKIIPSEAPAEEKAVKEEKSQSSNKDYMN